ncbi:hypothetical protein BDR04DRAFT_1226254 [Suillus decipiens]|nr:hypothetical protein BDR04DRAFT_1226254 [Suillus decipiens]
MLIDRSRSVAKKKQMALESPIPKPTLDDTEEDDEHGVNEDEDIDGNDSDGGSELCFDLDDGRGSCTSYLEVRMQIQLSRKLGYSPPTSTVSHNRCSCPEYGEDPGPSSLRTGDAWF